VKDWSLTAWGENHATFSVSHSDSSLESAKMPEYTDDKTNVTPPQPTPNPDVCIGCTDGGDDGDNNNDTDWYDGCADTDDGALDPYGYGCEYYTEDQYYCEHPGSVNDVFDPTEMCCACGGGNKDDDTTPGPDPTPDGDCVDSNEVDPYGDGCDWYEDNQDWCDYVFDGPTDLNPMTDCCICNGGDDGSNPDDGDIDPPAPCPDCDDGTPDGDGGDIDATDIINNHDTDGDMALNEAELQNLLDNVSFCLSYDGMTCANATV